MEDINKTLREMQTTCRFILKRANELTQKSHMCSCTRTIDEVKREIKPMSEKLTELQEQHYKWDAALEKMQKQIGELTTEQDVLKADLALIDQTDDLKIKRSGDLSDKYGKYYKHKARKEGVATINSVMDTGCLEFSGPSSNETDDELSQHALEEPRKIEHAETKETDVHNRKDVDMSFNTENKQKDIAYEDHDANGTTKTKPVTFAAPAKGLDALAHSEEQTVQKDLPTTPKLVPNQHSSTSKRGFIKYDSESQMPAGSNFQSRTDEPSVEVLKQTYKKYVRPVEWKIRGNAEIALGKASGMRDVGGLHTILLVDISESMQPTWKYVKTFVYDYLGGLENIRSQYGLDKDYVALVTFGHETKVQQRLTNDFKLLLQCFDCLKVGGPSPLSGGFYMAVAAAGSSEKTVCNVGELEVRTRVIIISDGIFTEPDLETGPDVADPRKQDLIRSALITDMTTTDEYNLDISFVPVGKADMSNFDLMVSLCRGTLLTYQDGYQVARRTVLALNADPFGFGPALELPETLSERDRADIKSMEEKARLDLDDVKNNEERAFHERDDDVLPSVGSRVRRGPDWQYDDKQDEFLPGTIVGHLPDAHAVWVDWDKNGQGFYRYRYGEGGRFDVLLVEEPVKLKPGTQIGIGCRVETGPAWKETSNHRSGVVLKLFVDELNTPRARVRWENKEQGVYTYMVDGNSLPEIIVCAEENTSTGRVETLRVSSELKASRKNKNKNTNA